MRAHVLVRLGDCFSYSEEMTHGTIRCAGAVDPALLQTWAEAWPNWFGTGRVPLPRAPARSELALVTTPVGPVVAKRARRSPWKRTLSALGRPARAVHAFRAAEDLRSHGLATPEPLAVLGGRAQPVLVTRYVEGDGPWEFVGAGGALETLVECLARELARLHAAGFRHRDLKASNLLLAGAREAPELFWTDLDGLEACGTVEPRVRARDLARLCTSFASAEARAAGVRAGHWPRLVTRYLEHALGRAPARDELEPLLARTRSWSERHIRKHLARGLAVR